MRLLVLASACLLSSCISVQPPVEDKPMLPITKYQRGPIPPLMPPPNTLNYISPDLRSDVVGAEKYAEDLITYTEYITNHLKFILRKYDIDRVDVKARCIATDEPVTIVLPDIQDIREVSDEDLPSVLIGHIENIYATVNKYNLETISLRERLCVD